jgi:hypothetical protein
MLLMGCSGITKTIYVKPTLPPMPDKPSYYAYEFDDDLKLNEDNAKNLLKNMELMKDYIRQLEEYIKGLL